MPVLRKAISNSRFSLVLLIIATLALVYLSLIKAPTIRIGTDTQNRVMHFLAYFVYGAITGMWRVTSKPGRTRWKIFLEASLPAAAYGTLLEWLQLYLPSRDSDPIDGLCNIGGGFNRRPSYIIYYCGKIPGCPGCRPKPSLRGCG